MPPQQALALGEFARTCKAAARAVSLYPPTHPAIRSSLARVVAATARLAGDGALTLDVHPDGVFIAGRTPVRPDPAIGELAALLHERLIGALSINRHAGADDWLALLDLLGRAPEDLIAGGGIGKAWAATGRRHFDIREIDYAEVLRERTAGGGAEWSRILASCLQGNVQASAAAILVTLRQRVEAAGRRGPQEAERAVEEMDRGLASFVANAIATEGGATDRLAQAFQVLVPEPERKERLLGLVRGDLERSELGSGEAFEELWQSAAQMLTSYSDQHYVSDAYGRELSGARTQALEVERVSDDPPERVQAWLSSVTDDAVRQLDLALLLDLLRLESEPAKWDAVAAVAVAEVERRVLLAEVGEAQQLTDAIVGAQGRGALSTMADTAVERLATGLLVRHIALYLRKAEEGDAALLNRLCQAIGPRIARPLAEALAVEENSRAILRLRELLLAFGAAGRQSVEQLKTSSNPAVRRMAIDLLRVFGGREALPELASMLHDADPQVQREAIRAIVQIGTNEAYAVLEHTLVGDETARNTVLQELIGLRDDKAIPLLCYVLRHSAARGKLVAVHTQIIEALGALSAHPDSTRILRTILYRGEWWAPTRTATLRRAAATALRRIAAPDTMNVLEEAAARGSRGVRAAARAQLATAPMRGRS